MNLFVYSIFDSKSSHFNNPFYAVNKDVAIRMVKGALDDPGTELAKWPTDFILYEIGVFDNEFGVLLAHNVIENLGILSTFKE